LRTRAIPERFCGGVSQRRGAISSVCTFTFIEGNPKNWGALGPAPLRWVRADIRKYGLPHVVRCRVCSFYRSNGTSVFTEILLIRNLTSRVPHFRQGHSRSSKPYRSATYEFLLLTFHSNHRPISYRFSDKRQFQSKFANFPHPVYFMPSLRGFATEFCH